MAFLDQWFVDPAAGGLLVFGQHEPVLVLLSVLVAVLTSAMALQLAGVARVSHSIFHRQLAIATGALALGGGVWAMHFIGMLAFQLCATVRYDPLITLASVLPSLFASWVALSLLAQRSLSSVQLVGGGVLVGAGIGAMHYSGMLAMQLAPLLRYDLWTFILSIGVAVALAILALWVRFGLRRHFGRAWALALGALVMGLAISGMHYTGMAAARFVGVEEFSQPRSIEGSFYLALAVAMATLSLSVLVAAVNGLLRYRDLYRQMQGSQGRMAAVLETAVDGIITIDERGQILAINPSVEKLFGWRESELIGQNIRLLMPEPHRSQHDGYLQHYLDSGEARIIGVGREVEGLHRDGRHLPIRLAIGRAELPGQVLYIGFITDISQRKAMEQALRESEQQYRSLIGNIPGVAFRCLLDEDWSMLFISDAVAVLTGWSAQDFTSRRKSIAELFHPDDRARIAEQVQQAVIEGRSYAIEYRLQDREGREHWIWESGSAVCDEKGVPRWIDGVLLDQTESKRRNAEYEGKVTAISKAMALIEFDLCGRILAINDNALQLFGYSSADELIGRHHRLFCDPQYADSEEYARFWQGLRAGQFSRGEYRRFGGDGQEVWIQATYNPILDLDGRPFKVVKLATDLTPRRLMEQELRAARDRAEQAAAARSSFLANMSHEIRTPMNAIIGFTDLLLDGSLDDTQRRHLQTVQGSSRSLLALLNDILDTAKLDRGAVELECLDFSLRELCEEVCAELRLGAERKGLALHLEYSPQLGDFFRGDALRLRQVLTNLLGNAVKFTERGEVRLRVEGESGAVRLAVEDTGIGIAADRLEGIFDPFAQADASMSRRFGGTGLGTTIARQLVELMGGSIAVSSVLGEGSVFSVCLPLPAGCQVQQSVRTRLPLLPPLRILAADDVAQNLELLRLNLEPLGHRVVAVADGQAAVEAHALEPFDLLLMDVQMPGMDGLQATRKIRARELAEGRLAVPIIALTASVLDRDRQEALDAGMNGFAVKPLELSALLYEMARLLCVPVEAEPESAPPEAVTALFDWALGKRLWGGTLSMVEAIGRFLGEQQGDIERLNLAWRQGDRTALRALSHRLRGAASNLALSRLASCAGDLEREAETGDSERLTDLIRQLVEQVDEIRKALPLIPQSVTEPSPAELSRGELLLLVERLRTALLRSELDDEALQGLLRALRHGPARADADELERAVDDFDFDHALQILQRMIVGLED